jgi:hypothetical protein
MKNIFSKVDSEEIIERINQKTAPSFIIKEDKNFDVEKNRLIEHISKLKN